MRYIPLTDTLVKYVYSFARPPHPILEELAAETAKLPRSEMQISPDQGALMHILAKLIGASRCLEIGCFTGYSAISVASALPADGQLISLDVSEEYAAIARRYFQAAGLTGKIDLRLAPALETLPKLEAEFGPSSFDMAFIDAVKTEIPAYFEHALTLVRPGGLILVDNVLWGGRVVDPADRDADTEAIRRFNESTQTDTRIEPMLLAISDGIFLCRKR